MPDNVISLIRPLDDWLHRARAAMAEGEFLSAVRFYRRALDIRMHPVILLETAYAYFSLHSYETVEALAEKALRRYPLDGEWCFLIAINAVNKGDHFLAREALEAYGVLDPMGGHRESVDRMLSSFPWHKLMPPRTARAQLLCRRAGTDPEKLIRAEKYDPTGRTAAVCAYALADTNPEKALRYVRKAQQKGLPRDAVTQAQLACMKAYRAMGHLPESEVAWEKAGAACTEIAHVDQMVRAAVHIRRFDQAEELLTAWMHLMPCAAHLLRLSGYLYQAWGKPQDEALMRRRLQYVDPFHSLCTQSYEETEQTLEKRRLMLYARVRPYAVTARKGDAAHEVH